LPVVKLEEIFTGNDDYGSIGCNLSPPLGPQYFCKRLNEIRERSNVHDVLVEINEVVEEDSTTWPFSESVYIFTNATHIEVAQWAAALQRDAVEEGFANGRPRRVKDLPPDIKK
jgi:hypothetical protein